MMMLTLIFLWKTQAACLPGSFVLEEKNLSELQRLESVVQDFEKKVEPELKGEPLVIRYESENNRVNAEILRDNGYYSIIVYGGMLNHTRMDEATLYLLLCHELGHALGGPPLKSRTGWSSTESQADYFSAGACFKKFIEDEKLFMDTALNLTTLYADVLDVEPPNLNSCDPNVVSRTNFGYPSIQCRLDTLIAGWRNFPRPRCWFFE